MTTYHLDPTHDLMREIADHSGPGAVFELAGGSYPYSVSTFLGPTRGGTRWGDKAILRARTLKGIPDPVILRPPPGAEKVIELVGGASAYWELRDLWLDGISVRDNALKLTHRGAFELGDHCHHVRLVRVRAYSSPYSAIVMDGYGHEALQSKGSSAGRAGRPDRSHGFYVPGWDNLLDDCDADDNTGWGFHFYDGSGFMRSQRNVVSHWRANANGDGAMVFDQCVGNRAYRGASAQLTAVYANARGTVLEDNEGPVSIDPIASPGTIVR